MAEWLGYYPPSGCPRFEPRPIKACFIHQTLEHVFCHHGEVREAGRWRPPHLASVVRSIAWRRDGVGCSAQLTRQPSSLLAGRRTPQRDCQPARRGVRRAHLKLVPPSQKDLARRLLNRALFIFSRKNQRLGAFRAATAGAAVRVHQCLGAAGDVLDEWPSPTGIPRVSYNTQSQIVGPRSRLERHNIQDPLFFDKRKTFPFCKCVDGFGEHLWRLTTHPESARIMTRRFA